MELDVKRWGGGRGWFDVLPTPVHLRLLAIEEALENEKVTNLKGERVIIRFQYWITAGLAEASSQIEDTLTFGSDDI